MSFRSILAVLAVLSGSACTQQWVGADAQTDARSDIVFHPDGSNEGPDITDVPPPVSCEITGCPAGSTCCASRGYCYDATACIACCPPAGATGPECQSDAQCAAGYYCEGVSCRVIGNCAPRPTSCDPTNAPVCGCDGMTYANACTAASMGQSVRTNGACAPRDAGPGPCNADSDCYGGQFCCASTHACYAWTCPGCCPGDRPCSNNTDCAADRYCSVCGGQSNDGGGGWCLRRPPSCGTEGATVCGCDGVTYSSECAANAAGQLVATSGACP